MAAAAGFVRVELTRAEPLMDLALFRRPRFATAVLGAVAVFVALNATLLLNTFHLQHDRGRAGAPAGRLGPRRPLLFAGAFTAAGGLCLVGLGPDTGVVRLLLAHLLIGVGFGFANAPIAGTAVGGLPPSRAGVAGASGPSPA